MLATQQRLTQLQKKILTHQYHSDESKNGPRLTTEKHRISIKFFNSAESLSRPWSCKRDHISTQSRIHTFSEQSVRLPMRYNGLHSSVYNLVRFYCRLNIFFLDQRILYLLYLLLFLLSLKFDFSISVYVSMSFLGL